MSADEAKQGDESAALPDTSELESIAEASKTEPAQEASVDIEKGELRLERNALIEEAIKRKNRGETEFTWLQDRLEEEEDYSGVLDILEASTAEEVYFEAKQGRSTSDLQTIREGALDKIFDIAQSQDLDPKEVLAQIQLRTFRSEADRDDVVRPKYPDYQGNRYYPDAQYWGFRRIRMASDEYHSNHKSQIIVYLKSKLSTEHLTADNLKMTAALQRHDEGTEELDIPTRVYFEYEKERMGEIEVSLRNILKANPGNPEELEVAMKAIESLKQGDIRSREAIEWFDGDLTMIQNFIAHCDSLGIHNAHLIATMFEQANAQKLDKRARQLSVQGIVDTANGLRKQLGEEAITNTGNDFEVQLPEAVDTLTDVILNYGQNNLTDEEKELLITYTKMACDVFIVGKFLRDDRYKDKTISEYLEENPNLSAARPEASLKPDQSSQPEARRGAQGLRQEFGSVVYWRARRPGFGVVS